MRTNSTLKAMRLDRHLTLLQARAAHARGYAELASERYAAARRINRAIVHYLRHVYR